jgi:hypothetical protein
MIVTCCPNRYFGCVTKIPVDHATLINPRILLCDQGIYDLPRLCFARVKTAVLSYFEGVRTKRSTHAKNPLGVCDEMRCVGLF